MPTMRLSVWNAVFVLGMSGRTHGGMQSRSPVHVRPLNLVRFVDEDSVDTVQRCVNAASTPGLGYTHVHCDLAGNIEESNANPRNATLYGKGARQRATKQLVVPLTVVGSGMAGGNAAEISGVTSLKDMEWNARQGYPNQWSAIIPRTLLDETPIQVFCDFGQGHMQWMPEARWPNVQLRSGAAANEPFGPLNKDSWAVTSNASNLRNGTLHCDELIGTKTNWTGGLATLNVGFRFLTWTRTVEHHLPGSGSFKYNQTDNTRYHLVGGTGAYADKGADNLIFLSGKLEALDYPGEWYFDTITRVLTVWMPDSGHPGNRVVVKTRDYCVDISGGYQAPFHLINASLVGCTFRLQQCNNCSITNVNNTFVSYRRTIDNRNVIPGPAPPVATLEGNGSIVTRLAMRYGNNGGIKVVGSNNTIIDSLFEDLTWLGTLDFPPIELGFSYEQPTSQFGLSTIDVPPLIDNTTGNDNVVTQTTVARVGEMGILTSQRSNEISYCHVHEVGLIGLDSAGLHADNTYVDCMNWSIPLNERPNCFKNWHHNWVHDASEKCVRGDDYNLNLSVHHNVVWNCGVLRDRNYMAATGVIIKGDYNKYYHNTVFNVTSGGQGDLCPVTSPLSARSWNLSQQNIHSELFNSVNEDIDFKSSMFSLNFEIFGGFFRHETQMGLRDPEHFDFRPSEQSPLRRAGIVVPHLSPLQPNGLKPDIGAYQYGDSKWTAGCTFSSSC